MSNKDENKQFLIDEANRITNRKIQILGHVNYGKTETYLHIMIPVDNHHCCDFTGPMDKCLASIKQDLVAVANNILAADGRTQALENEMSLLRAENTKLRTYETYYTLAHQMQHGKLPEL
jgi:hypothetical protein